MQIVRTAIGAAVAAAFLVSAAAAEEPSPYKAMGAPSNPKVPAAWNRYRDYAEVTELLKQLAAAHPDKARLQSLGKSHGGREMWLLTVANFEKGKPEDKPGFWIDGGIHANEVQSVEVPLYTAWYLLEMYGKAPAITRLVDERVFYILPMLSPDSRDAHMHKPNTTHSPRTGQRPVDDDRDGLVDEDPAEDLDGDGSITRMRVRDPNGRYKQHPKFPNHMIEAEPDEKGEFDLVGQEGFDNDGDGEVNEDGDGSYDPNRDFAWNWQPRYIQRGAYRYPLSIGENRMMAEFVAAHPNISGAQSYHNTAGMILRGPGTREERYDSSDLAVYDRIGKQGEIMLPGYRYVNIAEGLYEVYGGEVDWFHQMHGAFVFTNELFTPFNYFRKPAGEGWFARDEDQHAFNKLLLFDEAFVQWKEFDHPQYGKVEIGGFKKEWGRQPPSFLLEEECHRNMAFTLYHADQMPLVKVQSIEVKPLAGGLQEVTAVLANERLTPTRSAADVKNKITPPDVATLTAPNGQVVLGLTSERRFFDEAKEQKRKPAELKIESIPGKQAVYARWIVSGEGPFTVTLKSVKGGIDTKSSK